MIDEKIDYSCLAKPFQAKMLTTVDNKFDYFTQFDEWNKFDTESGYNTLALIARFMPKENDLTFDEYNQAIDDAIKKVIQIDVLDQYIIVSKTLEPKFLSSNEEALLM